jgi:hypothetical protein
MESASPTACIKPRPKLGKVFYVIPRATNHHKIERIPLGGLVLPSNLKQLDSCCSKRSFLQRKIDIIVCRRKINCRYECDAHD